jgi:hypothetical protein
MGFILSYIFLVEFIFLFLVLDFFRYLQQHSDHAFLQFLFTVKDGFAGCRNLVCHSFYFRTWNILFCAILSFFCKVCCYSDRFTFIYDSLLLSWSSQYSFFLLHIQCFNYKVSGGCPFFQFGVLKQSCTWINLSFSRFGKYSGIIILMYPCTSWFIGLVF